MIRATLTKTGEQSFFITVVMYYTPHHPFAGIAVEGPCYVP
jgi:hypothetical protein